MKTRVLLISLMLVFFANLNYAEKNRIDFEQFTLENGLDVILHQDNTTPNIVVNVMYHVGAKDESPDRTGFAHFFEHLMFQGTEHIGRGEFSEIIEAAGGSLNAFTSFDITNYFILLPSNQLELGLWMESERMLHLLIDSTGIAIEKDVVTEEMKQTRDNRPYGRLLTETISRAFTKHPYQTDVLGIEEHIRDATKEDIIAFHNMFYVPQNATLVVAGDIDIDEAKEMVEKYFADIPKGTEEIERPPMNEPKRTEELRDTVYDEVQVPALLKAYMIPAIGTPDYYAVEMLGYILSRGQSSRLYRRLVDEEEAALQVSAMPLSMEHPGITLMLAFANMGVELEDIERIIEEEMEKVKNELISEKELQKVKNQIESQKVNSNTTIAQRATNLANYHILYGDANLINTEIDRYMEVTREDIKRVAQKYFREDNRVVLYWLPKAES